MKNKNNSLLKRRQLIKDCKLKEGEIWVVGGFLRVNKKVKNMCFSTIADKSGQIQVLFGEYLDLKRESVLLVEGKLVKRKSPNLNIFLGEWELLVISYEVLSTALKSLPFELISSANLSLEKTRFKYRYLDLRRNFCEVLIKKSQILNCMRDYLISQKFTEIHTPALSVSTKEGSNTFDTFVIREGMKAKFSLSQSPQLYKQLLMIAGLERYFQIVNCFRMEDLRSDRQYEFLQLDLEMSFSSQEELFSIMEGIMSSIFYKVLGINLKTPFLHLSYDEALEKYGSDKPDLRHEREICEFTTSFSTLLLENNHFQAFGLFLKDTGIHSVENKWIDLLVTKNPIYILKIENKKIVSSHIMNLSMNSCEIQEKEINLEDGTLLLSTCDLKTKKNVLISLGNLRLHFSRKTENELRGLFKFVWIVDWPLFEYNEIQNNWVISHHLFTKPASSHSNFDKKSERSLGYDLVLNGVELASGSQRIDDVNVQRSLMRASGLSDADIEKDFGWFLEAFNYGVPPHLGIALGVDRLIQILLNLNSIRDTIAFPKNNSGVCMLTNSPEIID